MVKSDNFIVCSEQNRLSCICKLKSGKTHDYFDQAKISNVIRNIFFPFVLQRNARLESSLPLQVRPSPEYPGLHEQV